MALGVLLFLALLLVLFSSCSTPAIGLDGGALKACPSSPNCVCSEPEHSSEDFFISPFEFPADVLPTDAFATLGALIGDRARIQERSDRYLHAVFTSTFMRFKDDLEARLDAEARRIHVRSASRVGHSDFGANRKRVQKLRRDFEAALR